MRQWNCRSNPDEYWPKMTSTEPRDFDTLNGQAKELIQAGQFQEAAVKYTETLHSCTNDQQLSICLANRSLAFFQLQDYGKALQDAERAIAKRPSYAKAHMRHSRALGAMGETEKAAAASLKAKQLFWKEGTEWTLQRNLRDLIGQLDTSEAGSQARKESALLLCQVLQEATQQGEKIQKDFTKEFINCEGPRVVQKVANSMEGHWQLDIKNGTTSAVDKLRFLPGPIGQAIQAYSEMMDERMQGKCC